MFEKHVTVELIEKYLKKFGWENFQALPEPGEKEGLIVTGWGSPGADGHLMAINPMVEKNCLSFVARRVVMAPPDATAADRLSGVLYAMAALNYKMIIGSWGFDPTDGEVVFKVAIPTEGGLDYEAFQHAMTVAVMSVETQGAGLAEILAGTKTGKDVADAF